MKAKIIGADVKCVHNLRESEESKGVYRPLGRPRIVGREGLKLLCALPDGRVLTSSVRGVEILDTRDGSLTLVDSREAQCAAVTADGSVTVMTDDGPLIFDIDNGSFRIRSGGRRDPVPISIVAEPMAPLTMSVDAVELSREYSPGDIPAERDRDAVRKRLRDAYAFLNGVASEQGVFFQPLVARWVLRDERGFVIHRGPLVLVMPPEGLPFDRPVDLTMPSRSETRQVSVSVSCFRLRIRTGAIKNREWSDRAASLGVEVSPCFHTWSDNLGETAGIVTVMRDGTSGVKLSAVMPGSERGLSKSDDLRNIMLVGKVCRGFDMASVTVTSIERPFESAKDVLGGSYALPALKEQEQRLASVLAAGLERADEAERRMSKMNVPHSFRARHISVTPGAVAYGDVTTLPFEGYSAADYAAVTGTEDVVWTARTKVFFRNGTESSITTQGRGHKPEKLSPLIFYPDGDAVGMDIVVEDDSGGTLPKRWKITLTEDESGLFAFGLTTGLTFREAVNDTSAWIDDTTSRKAGGVRFDSLAAVADPLNPTEIKTICETDDRVTGLVPAVSTSGAWDFGRTRFNIFTAEKTMLMNAAPDLRKIALSEIGAVGVADEGGIARIDESLTFFVAPTGHIYRINGSRLTFFAKPHTKTDRLGYDPGMRQLVAGSSTGANPLYHIDTATGETVMTSDSPGPYDAGLTVGNRLLVPTQDGLADIAGANRAFPSGVTKVKMECAVGAIGNARGIKPVAVFWNVDSEKFDGTLGVRRSALSGRSVPVTVYTVRGRIGSPLRMPLMMRPSMRTVLEINATVSADTAISKPFLNVKML